MLFNIVISKKKKNVEIWVKVQFKLNIRYLKRI